MAGPFSRLMNYSLSTGTFPVKWKTAQVTPLCKGGSHNKTDNYRPISVLPIITKVLEKHVATSFCNYLHERNLIYKFQSGFHPNHSTETALINLVDDLLFNMDNNMVTGLTFIDFKKAFDVINHNICLKKLEIYGVGSSSINWFKSYINDMPLHKPDSNLTIYADDTTLAESISVDEIPLLTQIINQDFGMFIKHFL